MDHTDVVARIKEKLIARNVDLKGPDGAFEITKRVAWELRGEGAGLLDKPGGNNSHGFATDYIVFRNGPSFDILGDGGGNNTPQWAEDNDASLLARWREPIDPMDTPVSPPVQPPPVQLGAATSPALDAVLAKLEALDQKLDALRAHVEAHDDANTEKVQQQIDQVVKSAEATLKTVAPMMGLFGGKK